MWEHIQSELVKVSKAVLNNNKKRKMVNKTAVFWFEFFSKRFRPGPSSVELQSTLETL